MFKIEGELINGSSDSAGFNGLGDEIDALASQRTSDECEASKRVKAELLI